MPLPTAPLTAWPTPAPDRQHTGSTPTASSEQRSGGSCAPSLRCCRCLGARDGAHTRAVVVNPLRSGDGTPFPTSPLPRRLLRLCKALAGAARVACACHTRRLPKPAATALPWLLRSALLLDASALVQAADSVDPVDTVCEPALGFGATPDAAWGAASSAAQAWLAAAHLGLLWPELVRLARWRHVIAAAAHIAATGMSVLSAAVLVTGVQAALSSGNRAAVIGYAFGLFAADVARLCLCSVHGSSARRAAQAMHHALQAALLIKAAAAAPGQVEPGAVASLLQSDAASACTAGECVSLAWAAPAEAVSICAVLYALVGVPVLPAIAVSLAVWGLVAWLSTYDDGLSEGSRRWRDALTRMTDDVFDHVRALKMGAWEAPTLDRLRATRSGHLGALWRAGWLASLQSILLQAVLPLAALASVGTACALGVALQPSFIVSLTLFGLLQEALMLTAYALRKRAAGVVAAGQVRAFLVMQTPPRGEAAIAAAAAAGSAPAELRLSPLPSPVSSVLNPLRVSSRFPSAPAAGASPAETERPAVLSSGVPGTPSFESAPSFDSAPSPADAAGPLTPAVVADGVSASWFARGPVAAGTVRAVALQQLSFFVASGTVLGVCGPDGSGKSALAALLLGDLETTAGRVTIRGRVAVTTTVPWVEAGSIRDNVLFGRPMRADWYSKVLEACNLEADAARFGHDAPVGEAGGRLSEGFQARVALARAVYAEADVYVLDDPLAKLDNVSASRVWEGCVRGLLRGRAVVFASQSAAFLRRCDAVLELEGGGKQVYFGPAAHAPLASSSSVASDAAVLTGVPGGAGAESPQSPSRVRRAHRPNTMTLVAEQDEPLTVAAPLSPGLALRGEKKLLRAARATVTKLRGPAASYALAYAASMGLGTGGSSDLAAFVDFAEASSDDAPRAEAEFTVAAGVVAPAAPTAMQRSLLSAFLRYLRADVSRFATAAFIFVQLAFGTHFVYKWWLTVVLDGMGDAARTRSLLLPVFAASIAGFIGALIANHAAARVLAFRASRAMHLEVLVALLRAPLGFYTGGADTAAHVKTVLTRDLGTLDSEMPGAVDNAFDVLVTTLGTVILDAALFPSFLAFIALVAGLAAIVAHMFNGVVVKYSDAENETAEPIVRLVGEIVTGGQVARAFGRVDAMLEHGGALIERHGAARMAAYAIARWQAVRLEFIAALLLLATVLLFASDTTGVSPAIAGLAITNVLCFGSLLSYFALAADRLLSCLSALARLEDLASVPPEEQWPEPGRQPALAALTASRKPAPAAAVLAALSTPPRSAARRAAYPYAGWDPECWNRGLVKDGWPREGAVVLDGVTVRYAPNRPAALKRVSLSASGGSSLGIVGPSGSGKSTFALALLRLVEADTPARGSSATAASAAAAACSSSGRILIDGVDIAELPLAQLRSAIGCVPQTPFILAGLSVREVLDPSGTRKPEDLVTALESCGLRGIALADPVVEGLASAQRQLLCFARALVQGARILLLDEVTACLDDQSSAAVIGAIARCTMQTAARRPTVLNIAHRLETVMMAERVAAFDAGEAVDFDAPSALLQMTSPEEAPPLRLHPRRGVFADLVRKAGPQREHELRAMAEEGYYARRGLQFLAGGSGSGGGGGSGGVRAAQQAPALTSHARPQQRSVPSWRGPQRPPPAPIEEDAVVQVARLGGFTDFAALAESPPPPPPPLPPALHAQVSAFMLPSWPPRTGALP